MPRVTPQHRKRYHPYRKPIRQQGWVGKDKRTEDAYASRKNKNAYDASQASYGSKSHEDKLFKQGYKLDANLSGEREKVFYDPSGDLPPIIAFRGTQDVTDVGADYELALGNYKGVQFRRANTLIHLSEMRYGKGIVTGHSLGGTKAIIGGNANGHEVVAFNPGTGLFPLEAGKATVFKTESDWIASRVRGENIYGAAGGHSINNFETEFDKYETGSSNNSSSGSSSRRDSGISLIPVVEDSGAPGAEEHIKPVPLYGNVVGIDTQNWDLGNVEE